MLREGRAARATRWPSRSSSCARATGAGRRSSPASASWPTSSPTRGCGSRRSRRTRAGSRSPTASRCRSSRSRARSGSRLPEPGEHSVVPPSAWGGNMDVKHLRVGTTLFLPVGVEGALFSVGDTHAAMGDGEVCGTAVEAPMDIVVRLTVRRDMTIAAPQYHVAAGELARTEAGSHHVTTGVGPDLMEAARDATRAMIGHLGLALRARPRGGLRALLGRLRPAHPRGRRRARTGWWGCSCPRRSWEVAHECAADTGTSPRAALLGDDRALDRRSWRRPRRWR